MCVVTCILYPIHGVNTRRGTPESMGSTLWAESNLLSGVNMDDDKWNTLTFNFLCVKDALNGKKDALKDIFTPPKDVTDVTDIYCTKQSGMLMVN